MSTTPQTSKETANGDDGKARRETVRVANLLGDGPWIWKFLVESRFWFFLLPWPLHHPLAAAFGKERVDKSNAWLTFGIAIWCYLAFVMRVSLESIEQHYAGDISKVLFSGAFLLGTILSVSVAMPGQAVMKAILGKDPAFAIDFVAPFLWAFLWGIAGGVLMLAFGGLEHVVPNHPEVNRSIRTAATTVALYGALMEMNALLHTVRTYTIGLVFMAREQSKPP